LPARRVQPAFIDDPAPSIHARIAPERHGRAFAAWNGVRNAAELGALAVGGIVVGAIGARSTIWLAGGLSALVGVAGLVVLVGWRGGAWHDVAAGAAETA